MLAWDLDKPLSEASLQNAFGTARKEGTKNERGGIPTPRPSRSPSVAGFRWPRRAFRLAWGGGLQSSTSPERRSGGA